MEKKTRQAEEEVGGQHQVPDGSGEPEKTGGKWLLNHLWCPNDPRG